MNGVLFDSAPARAAKVGMGLGLAAGEIHRYCEMSAYFLGRLEQVAIGTMKIASGGLVPPATEQFADRRQVLRRHDGVTRRRVTAISSKT